MKEINPTRKLSRKEIAEGLDTIPIAQILGKSVSRELTAKQKKFAREVAKGATKADAYRKAYKPTSKWTMQTQPYQLAKDERVANEIAAYKLAIETAEHRTPAALRELVIQTLAQVLVDPEAKQAVKVQAAKVLGTVTEVAAFTERKEVRTISSSEDARAQLMAQIRELTKAQATDVEVIEHDAESLLAELAGDGPHPSPTPHEDFGTPGCSTHINPHEQSEDSPTPQKNSQEPDTTPLDREDPPVGVS